MKVCIIQPPYSTDYSLSEQHFLTELELLDACDGSMDIIVMPEACDVPCLAHSPEDSYASAARFNAPIIEKVKETARRCNAMVFINARSFHEKGQRNTTYAIDRGGNIVGMYHKQHLTPGEVFKLRLDHDYSFEFEEPTVIEMEGFRFAFLTCYDFYFYEEFANIARQNVDFVIGCSHQRSDTHSALEIMSRFLAYNTNAYVLRASVSMDESSDIGGASMIVAPNGDVLTNLYSKVGMATVEIDPRAKYYKPAGFGNPLAAHYEYIEKGRRPWKYRPGGSAIARHDHIMPYPRVCAHRGFNTIAPENSLPAFGAAIAMGAQEIEFDLWYTTDGVVVSSHDSKLDRVSDGTGRIYEHSYEELLTYDFGFKFGEKFKGMKILTFEEILKKFSCHCVMNIHVKTVDNKHPADGEFLKKIIALVRKYDCEKYIYFMSGNDFVLEQLIDLAPDLSRCCGGGDAPYEMVERAVKYGCKKIQLVKGKFTEDMIARAHEQGIACNIFWSDDPEETARFLDMGIDTILTNDYCQISQVVEAREKYVYY